MSKEDLHMRIDNDFGYHKPEPEDAVKMDALRQQFRQLAHMVIETCPEGRDLSMAITDLETAQRCAIASIAKQGPLG